MAGAANCSRSIIVSMHGLLQAANPRPTVGKTNCIPGGAGIVREIGGVKEKSQGRETPSEVGQLQQFR